MYENYFENVGVYLSRLQVLTNTFQKWNYLPTLIPILDEHKVYNNIKDATSKNTVKVIDSSGEVLLLRSDMTISLAKLMRSHLNSTQLPLRVYYFDNVVRSSHYEHDIDLLQIGIELIGNPNITGDFEVIGLLDTALSKLKIPEYKIFLGAMDVITALLPNNISKTETQQYYNAISKRDIKKISKYIGNKVAQTLLHICPANEINYLIANITKNSTKFNSQKNKNLLQNYKILVQNLHSSLKTPVFCDLSELGNHSYYTGSVFSIYMKDCPVAIAHGGRYDNLLHKFNISHQINKQTKSTKTNIGACGGTIFPSVFAKYLLPKKSTKSIYNDKAKKQSMKELNKFIITQQKTRKEVKS